jgi:hypothetical protein
MFFSNSFLSFPVIRLLHMGHVLFVLFVFFNHVVIHSLQNVCPQPTVVGDIKTSVHIEHLNKSLLIVHIDHTKKLNQFFIIKCRFLINFKL